MTFYEELLLQTEKGRQNFLSIPIIRQTVENGVTKELYIAYLEQAYHHVKHTCCLLSLAASRCDENDRDYQNALFEYIQEEKGHELWILDDISALGGDAVLASSRDPSVPCAAMVGYAYYAIEHISPYCLLGMVHVLEGMSVALAQSAANSISETLGRPLEDGGFKYLISHGALDQDHVTFFQKLVNGITCSEHKKLVTMTATIMYELYGNVFRSLDQSVVEGASHAA